MTAVAECVARVEETILVQKSTPSGGLWHQQSRPEMSPPPKQNLQLAALGKAVSREAVAERYGARLPPRGSLERFQSLANRIRHRLVALSGGQIEGRLEVPVCLLAIPLRRQANCQIEMRIQEVGFDL